MTFVLTAVAVEPEADLAPVSSHIELEEVVQDEHAWSRAGYLPGLSRYLGEPVTGTGYHLLVDEGQGWKTSNVFLPFPDDDDAPVRLTVPEIYRWSFDQVLRELVHASAVHRVLLIVEYNGSVTAPDLSDEAAQTVDIVGPLTIDGFWIRHDLGEILEESVVILQE